MAKKSLLKIFLLHVKEDCDEFADTKISSALHPYKAKCYLDTNTKRSVTIL